MNSTAPLGVSEPRIDAGQVGRFADLLFRYADDDTFASLRAFVEGHQDVYRIDSVLLHGDLAPLVERAIAIAEAAATAPMPVVFCPPIATFDNAHHAREADLANGLALSVECDHGAATARRLLEQLLGPATVVVASGG
jgi:hypothetical protein